MASNPRQPRPGSASPPDLDRFQQYLRRGAPGPHAYVILLGLEAFDPVREVVRGQPRLEDALVPPSRQRIGRRPFDRIGEKDPHALGAKQNRAKGGNAPGVTPAGDASQPGSAPAAIRRRGWFLRTGCSNAGPSPESSAGADHQGRGKARPSVEVGRAIPMAGARDFVSIPIRQVVAHLDDDGKGYGRPEETG